MGGHYYGTVQANHNSRLHLGDNHFYGIQERLKHVPSALYDAYGIEHHACHPKTRRELLEKIARWAGHPTSPSIFWLSGMAGTGKSTLSYTVAEKLDQDQTRGYAKLGASFFFKRGEGDRASAKLLFPTIASQLATRISFFSDVLTQTVKAHPQICDKALGEQFKRLIHEPLQRQRSETGWETYVIVIDALDECDNESDIRTVLQLWSSFPVTSGTRLRLLLTSRPELAIRMGFKKMSADIHQDVVLHEVPQPVIEHDILAYLTDAFTELREEHNLESTDDPLADDWPGADLLRQLTNIAVPLFIVAATIYRFIKQAELPQEALNKILKYQKIGHLSDMGKVYSIVLKAMAANLSDRSAEEKLYHEFRLIVGTIICLAEPLSRRALAALLCMAPGQVQLRLRSLHALLDIHEHRDISIRPLHLSFGEFLTSEEVHTQPFSINAQETHHILWRQCLRLLSSADGLREDICGLRHPGRLRGKVSASVINQCIPAAMQYACRYWVYHVQYSIYKLYNEDEVHTFLQEHFLHWLEALSLLDRLADAIKLVDILYRRIAAGESDSVVAFLEDAQRFILANRYIGEIAPLQLYSSAIAFSPQKSIIRKICGHLPTWIQLAPITSLTWTLELQKLEGHTNSVEAVAFLPDGSMLASASDDETVRLWQVSTGREVQKLEGHTGAVKAAAFSPDGSMLASASDDETVRLWQVSTGQEIQQFKYPGYTSQLSFSPDGTTICTDTQPILIPRSVRPPNECKLVQRQITDMNYGLALNCDWIEHQGRRILWLPHEYRTDVVAMSGNTIVIGQSSGAVSFLRIEVQ